MKHNINLGQYDLNQLLRNPALIHLIQDALLALEGENMLVLALGKGAKDNAQECIKTIISAYSDNPQMIINTVGEDILKLIEEYEGITLADDVKNVL